MSSFCPLPDYHLVICGSRYSWCAVLVFGFPLCSWMSEGGTKWEFATTWILGLRTKISRKPEVSSLIDLIFAMTVLFFDMTLTAQEPGSLLWCHAISSLQLTHVRFISCRDRLRNLGANSSIIGLHCVTVAWQQSFTSSCGSRHLAACDSWRHLWQVMQRDNNCCFQ